MLERMHRYPVGSKIQHRNHYVFVKTREGAWQSEQRWVAENRLLHRNLDPGERVYHRNGEKDDNSPDNLAVIRFRTTQYKLLARSRPIYIPKVRELVRA